MKSGIKTLLKNKNILFSELMEKGNCIFMFPGHGAQYPDMLRGLYEKYGVVKDVFRKADEVYRRLEGEDLTSCIFTSENRSLKDIEKKVNTPRVMQTGIFTSSMAIYYLLESEGITTEYLIGHSLGELAALCAAGVFDFETGVEIAYHRAVAVEQIPAHKRGGMLAITAAYTDELAQELLSGELEECQVSIVNSKSHFNVSGSVSKLERLKEKCQAKNITAHLLNVSHAFHSEIMRPAVEPYKQAIRNIKFKKPEKHIFSTILQREYTQEDFQEEKFVDIISSQLVTPFNFRDMLTDICKNHKISYLLEIGPSNMLSKIAGATLEDKQIYYTNERKKDSIETYLAFKAECVISGVNMEKKDKFSVKDKIKQIVSKATMYPQSVIELNEQPFFLDLAITERVFEKIAMKLSEELGITKKITKDMSLLEVYNMTEAASENNDVYKSIVKYLNDTYGIDGSQISRQSSLDELCKIIDNSKGIKEGESAEREGESLSTVNKTELQSEYEVNSISEKPDVKEFVVGVIQEKTGYPVEFLEDTADLEADLGIDSVKQGEIFAKIQERYNVSIGENESIKNYSTIDKIVMHVSGKISASSEESGNRDLDKVEIPVEKNLSSSFAGTEEVRTFVLKVIQDKTGYPAEVLEDDLDLEADLGIDSVKQGEIFAKVQDEYNFSVNENENIKDFSSIAKIVQYVLAKIAAHTETTALDCQEETAVLQKGDTASHELVDRVEVKKFVLETIQDKTGYPKEVLEDNLDLEADLGIDSVKQGEIFSKIQDKYQYDLEENENYKNFNTITRIVDYAVDKCSTDFSKGKIETVLQPDPMQKTITDLCEMKQQKRFTTVAVETPFDEKKGKHFSFSDKLVLVIADSLGGEITADLVGRLAQVNAHVVVVADYKLSAIEQQYLTDFYNEEKLKETFETILKKHGEISVIINCRSLSEAKPVDSYTAEEWDRIIVSNYNACFYSARLVYNYFEENKDSTAYFALTNMGGCLGYEKAETGYNSVGAVTSGFIKGMERELRPFNCKVLDFTNVADSAFIVQTAMQELSLMEEAVEICFDNFNVRKRPYVINKEITNKNQTLEINHEDVIFVTGGGRGIVYEFIDILCSTCNPQVVFTGRTKRANGDEKWLQMTSAEFDAFKADFMVEEKRRNPKATILEINENYVTMKNSRELEENIRILAQKGYHVEYVQCNVSDVQSIENAIKYTIQKYGKITGIINGAGLPAFGKIPKKSEKQSREVVRVKANSFYGLKSVCKMQPLKFFISIGSISGRFGMDGQVDYSAGADLIVRLSCEQKQTEDPCKYTVMGWSAWDEVGMATYEGVKKVQQEVRGLEYLQVAEGKQWFIEEVLYGCESPEALIFGKLGQNMPLGQMDYYDSENKKSISCMTEQKYVIDKIAYPLIDRVEECRSNKISAVHNVTAAKDIHLQDHKVEDTSVFAGVMHIESGCELFQLFLEMNHLTDNYKVTIIEDFHFEQFIKVFENEKIDLHLSGKIVEQTDSFIRFQVEIRSDFVNKKGIVLQKDRLHSYGTILANRKDLCKNPEKFSIDLKKAVEQSSKIDLSEFYKNSQQFIEFGKTFQSVVEAGKRSDTEYVGIIHVSKDAAFFYAGSQIDTVIHPVAVDNIGRFMLFYDCYENGYSVVPIRTKEIKIFRSMYPGETLYVYCKYVEQDDKTVTMECITVDKDNNLVLDMGTVQLARINKYEVVS